jgi:hypothetical protein
MEGKSMFSKGKYIKNSINYFSSKIALVSKKISSILYGDSDLRLLAPFFIN